MKTVSQSTYLIFTTSFVIRSAADHQGQPGGTPPPQGGKKGGKNLPSIQKNDPQSTLGH